MKNIIFDIGMVLVDFHWKSTMEKLGIPADVIDTLDHNMINHPMWNHFDLDDMTETLKNANGVGLAGPQVAKLRRVVVIIIDDKVYELINPEITWQSEEKQRVLEGCLSCPNEWGYVTRPMRVKFKAQDRHGKWYEMEVSELFAQCVCHELAHLEGHLFTEIVEEFVEVED